ncbi:MAG TPA: aminoglycoside phosphotransferase family protein [Gemmatimonadaceae bacterium]
MSTQRYTARVTTDDAELRLTVERLLARADGRPVKVATLTRTPSPFATLFPVEVLSLSMQGGGAMSLFVKHLGAEQADHPEKRRRDREVRIYEELLGEGELPVVRYYGCEWNEGAQRREVFLEHIADWDLRYQDLEHWFTAARCLARLHAHFADRAEQLLGCDFLLRFDAHYLHEWADRALGVVAGYAAELEDMLSRVAGEYARVASVLARQPVTLVHNDLAPKNVLADRAHTPARIGFVDWEMAGVGCGVLDVVDLKYGLDPASDAKMCAAYCAALAGTGLLPGDRRELDRLFAACELHKTVHRLAHSASWRLPIDTVARWTREAEQLLARV